MIAIGIDLGTTNSAAALSINSGAAKVLPTRAGEQLTPSVVSYVRKRNAPGEIVVGRQAVSYAARNPEETIFSIKRLMGLVYGEQRVDEVKRWASYSTAPEPENEEDDQTVKVALGDALYTPVDISAMILSQIKRDAEAAINQEVTHAVITVPAYFHDRQRAATAAAGEKAGLSVLKIIDEPTAAAIAFGADRQDEKHRVIVYDLGGGTFDISMIQMVNGQYQVMDMDGDNWLGGDDFDNLLVDRITKWVKENYDYDPGSDRFFLGQAKAEAQKIKIALSSQESVEVVLPGLGKLPDGALIDVDMVITRAEFNKDILPLVERSVERVEAVMQRQHIKPDDISQVLLVGGSTLVPQVHEAVSNMFGAGRVKRDVNPMECVALGAAILAASMPLTNSAAAPEPSVSAGPKLVETTPMHMGIAAVQGNRRDAFVPIIKKGTQYPLRAPCTRTFRPSKDNQTVIRIPVYEGMNDIATLNDEQGVIEFKLPEGIRATDPVEVSLNYDTNRLLTVGIRVLGRDIEYHEVLRRDRRHAAKPREDPNSLKNDWREELVPAIRVARQFTERYDRYMSAEDKRQLRELADEGEKALSAGDVSRGQDISHKIETKVYSSGVASTLYFTEQLMSDSSPETSRILGQLMLLLQEAFRDSDRVRVEELRRELERQNMKLLAEKAPIESIPDQIDTGNLLET